MKNLLDPNEEYNFLFLASALAVLCESSPITLDLRDIERFWSGDIKRFQYDMVSDPSGKTGSITFSLKEKVDE